MAIAEARVIHSAQVGELLMIHGILSINLDPPYVGFSQDLNGIDQSDGGMEMSHMSSTEEIRNLLLHLNAITPDQIWPLEECIIRIPLTLPIATLKRFGLSNELPSPVLLRTRKLLKHIS